KLKLKSICSKVTITFDVYSKKLKSFLGICAHWIENYELNHVLIEIKEVTKEHSGQNLAEIIFDTLQFYEITSKIKWATTDNASNNITAINHLSALMNSVGHSFHPQESHVRCMNHIINL